MRYRIKRKQPNSKMCLVCGLQNSLGLRAAFYELENDELLAIFRPLHEHQGYPGRLHGGMALAILDETIGRAIMINNSEDIWGVTIEFTSRFRQAVPLNEEIRVTARITTDGRRMFEGAGEIILKDGSVAVVGRGKYLKYPIDKIADFGEEDLGWGVVPFSDDPDDVEL
ncbi:MAG: PaaI family thioesterase [Deltaproteobacteria bacterium]|nr:PaaI family thioesterase [Deltaproteobacteria bacterium]